VRHTDPTGQIAPLLLVGLVLAVAVLGGALVAWGSSLGSDGVAMMEEALLMSDSPPFEAVQLCSRGSDLHGVGVLLTVVGFFLFGVFLGAVVPAVGGVLAVGAALTAGATSVAANVGLMLLVELSQSLLPSRLVGSGWFFRGMALSGSCTEMLRLYRVEHPHYPHD
jgi:hypothetical protein